MEFYATCPAGFEKLLAHELSSLGVQSARPLKGQVSFEGSLVDGQKACLWSSLASRIVCVLGRFAAATSDELYAGVLALPWEDHIASTSTLEIEAHGTNESLRNTQFVALRTKDAISDRLLQKRGIRPATDTTNPDIRVAVRLGRTRASIGIDLSGEPLFRRGYAARKSSRAPLPLLRPDYAAALLECARWYADVRHGNPEALVLYSGAGTIATEAASQALDRAPGLLRPSWGFTGWLGNDEEAWKRLSDEAQERAEAGAHNPITLICADTRPGAESSLSQMLRQAGMGEAEPRFFDMRRQAEDLAKAVSALKEPAAFIDLSWLREGALPEEAEALSLIAEAAPALASGTKMASLAPGATLASVLGTEPEESTAVLQGSQQEQLSLWHIEEVPERPLAEAGDQKIPVLLSASDQFAKRLQKVAKLRAKWARREGISCYRVYDQDLPDYAVAIELYEGTGTPERWLQISEYTAPKDIDPILAHERLLDVLTIAPRIMKVAPDHVYLKVRTRAKGGSQYADEGAAPEAKAGRRRDGRPLLPKGAHLVEEGGLVFEVSFEGRLDCGIFLDHRDTRALIRELAKKTKGSKRFLNLFAYTGTATCYAADGGMYHTTTVDMSRPSLEWARRNMERNGFSGPEHEYVQADVLSWVQQERHTRDRWDLIFCDVPTFSNSSRMHASWDVQRDHAELLIGVSRLLTRDGVCVFSCNLRSFKPDTEKLQKAGVEIEDITAQTIPEDFARNPKIHHCYLVKRTPRPEGDAAPAEHRSAPRPKGASSAHRDQRPAGSHTTGGRPSGGRPQGPRKPGSGQGRPGTGRPGRRPGDAGGPAHRSPYSARY
ncbi:MAG: bifunctional 23S rRNA (guanine(2069)-N(7))-methyltransferase RlmK/23S rRNA (guanine(2445)-N(2))-methyltransferase RlmL [Atopobiaceae bacterium]